MKKSLIILFCFYAVLLVAVIISKPSDKGYVTILNVKEELSRILYGEELLEITVYASDDTGFLFDRLQIEKASLVSDDCLTEVTITNIIHKDESVTYRGTQYKIVKLMIQFIEFQFEQGTDLQFDDCVLKLEYENGEQLSLELGSVHLLIQNEVVIGDLSVDRLYGVTNRASNQGTISGIVIELSNRSETVTEILDLSVRMDHIEIDLDHIQILSSSTNIETEEDTLVSTIDIVSLHDFPISFSDLLIVYLPFVIEDNSLYFHRFPVAITYTHLGVSKTQFIDDFIYFSSQFNDLEVFTDELSITRYYYN